MSTSHLCCLLLLCFFCHLNKATTLLPVTYSLELHVFFVWLLWVASAVPSPHLTTHPNHRLWIASPVSSSHLTTHPITGFELHHLPHHLNLPSTPSQTLSCITCPITSPYHPHHHRLWVASPVPSPHLTIHPITDFELHHLSHHLTIPSTPSQTLSCITCPITSPYHPPHHRLWVASSHHLTIPSTPSQALSCITCLITSPYHPPHHRLWVVSPVPSPHLTTHPNHRLWVASSHHLTIPSTPSQALSCITCPIISLCHPPHHRLWVASPVPSPHYTIHPITGFELHHLSHHLTIPSTPSQALRCAITSPYHPPHHRLWVASSHHLTIPSTPSQALSCITCPITSPYHPPHHRLWVASPVPSPHHTIHPITGFELHHLSHHLTIPSTPSQALSCITCPITSLYHPPHHRLWDVPSPHLTIHPITGFELCHHLTLPSTPSQALSCAITSPYHPPHHRLWVVPSPHHTIHPITGLELCHHLTLPSTPSQALSCAITSPYHPPHHRLWDVPSPHLTIHPITGFELCHHLTLPSTPSQASSCICCPITSPYHPHHHRLWVASPVPSPHLTIHTITVGIISISYYPQPFSPSAQNAFLMVTQITLVIPYYPQSFSPSAQNAILLVPHVTLVIPYYPQSFGSSAQNAFLLVPQITLVIPYYPQSFGSSAQNAFLLVTHVTSVLIPTKQTLHLTSNTCVLLQVLLPRNHSAWAKYCHSNASNLVTFLWRLDLRSHWALPRPLLWH